VLLSTCLTISLAVQAQSRMILTHYVQGYDLSETTTPFEQTRFSTFVFRSADGGFLPAQLIGKTYQPTIATKFIFVGIPEGATVRINAKALATEKQSNVLLSPFESQDTLAPPTKKSF
jgi:hypothetical protein